MMAGVSPNRCPNPSTVFALHWTLSVADNYNLYFSATEGDGKSGYLSFPL